MKVVLMGHVKVDREAIVTDNVPFLVNSEVF